MKRRAVQFNSIEARHTLRIFQRVTGRHLLNTLCGACEVVTIAARRIQTLAEQHALVLVPHPKAPMRAIRTIARAAPL